MGRVFTGIQNCSVDRLPEGAAWTSEPQFFEGPSMDLEYNGEVDLCAFVPQPTAVAHCSGWGGPSDVSFCIEVVALGDCGITSAAEWTLGRLLHRRAPGCDYDVAVDIWGQRVRLPEVAEKVASFEMREVF